MKKILIISIFIFILISLAQNVFAVDLLLKYPEIKGQRLGEGDAATLPGIMRYIYLFSLGIVGFVALLSILIGALKYVGSAGNASKVGEAKEQIKSALLGIIILLAAVTILNIINPDLVKLGLDLPEMYPAHFESSCRCFPTEGSNESIFKGCFPANDCRNQCENLCEGAAAYECYVNATECNQF